MKFRFSIRTSFPAVFAALLSLLMMTTLVCASSGESLLAPGSACAEAAEETELQENSEDDDLMIEEVIEYVNLDAVYYGGVEWTFPLSLEEMQPDLIVLANKHYKLDKSFVPQNLVKVPRESKNGIAWAVEPKNGQQLRDVCSEALCAMNRAIQAEGTYDRLYLKSAYRAWSTQDYMYKSRLEKNHGKDDGWVSQAGASDHQTGLGCDVVPRKWKDKAMNDKMMAEPECQWMAEHCQEFGFIIRYPEDKQDVTEINTEPWHLRFVGIPVATYIMSNGLCLEEFTWLLQDAIEDFIARGGDSSWVEAYIQKPTDQQN